MALNAPVPPDVVSALARLQRFLQSAEGRAYAVTFAACFGLAASGSEIVSLETLNDCIKKTVAEVLDPTVRTAIERIWSAGETVVTDLRFILDEVGAGILSFDEAVDGLLELGLNYSGPDTNAGIVGFISPYLEGSFMAAFPALSSPPVCVTPTGQQHKGICCSALTQLGATQAAIGFQYTDCKGRTRCMKCGVGTSTSTRHPGRPIFIPRRVQCGPSGCPALSQT